MALHTTTTAYQVPYQMPHVAEPVAIVLADQAPLNAEGDPCNWGVPPNASNKVKAVSLSSSRRITTTNKILFFQVPVLLIVCVCFLPIHSGHQVRWTYHQPGSHRRKVTQDFSSTFFLRCVP